MAALATNPTSREQKTFLHILGYHQEGAEVADARFKKTNPLLSMQDKTQ